MVAPNRSFNRRDPKAGNSLSLHGLPARLLSNYGTVGNALKDPRVVLPAITPALDPPPCIIASIGQPFHHTNSMSRRLLRSRSASGLGVAPGWPGTPPRLRRPLSGSGYNRFDNRTHPNTPKSPSLFKRCCRHRRLHRRAACGIEPLELFASNGDTPQ